jgi:hypothetical protein
MEENFLVTWENADGETRFLMFPMTEHKKMRSLTDKLADRAGSKLSVDDVDKLVLKAKEKAVKDYTVKTYDNNDWPFADDNIKKIISLPEFGW